MLRQMVKMKVILLLFVFFIGIQARNWKKPRKMGLHLWSVPSISYHFAKDYPEHARKRFKAAVAEINSHTCIQFHEKNELAGAIPVTEHGRGCVSTKGRHGVVGKQAIKANSTLCQEGHMLHLLMYVLGVPAEHQRADRNKRINVVWEIVNKEQGRSFIHSDGKNGYDLNVPYDFSSITHIPDNCCSENGKPTITTHIKGANDLMGQRYMLTLFDIIKLNRLYHCDNDTYYLGLDLFPLPDNWYEKDTKYRYEPARPNGKIIGEIEIPGLPDEAGILPKSQCICGRDAFEESTNWLRRSNRLGMAKTWKHSTIE